MAAAGEARGQEPAVKRARVDSAGGPAGSTDADLGPAHVLANGCRKVDCYRKINRIDEGTYGVVYRAQEIESGEVVALKQLKLSACRSDDGFPISSVREISLLLKLHHPNIVRCREVVVGQSQQHIFMVLDYVEHELKALVERHRFSVSEVKCLMLQLLSAVVYLHKRWVVHRDLKTTNVLLDNSGVLKVCDFGLARHYGEPLRPYTQNVQSLWYRAPELLLGQKGYNTGVDVWSCGCIFAEMFLRRPAFEGKAELHQVGLIFDLVGVPTEDTWPGIDKLPMWRKAPFKLALPRWRILFPDKDKLSQMGLELMQAMLECCPARRFTAAECYEDEYFSESPPPQEASMMPSFQETNSEGRQSGASTRGLANRGGPLAPAKLRVE